MKLDQGHLACRTQLPLPGSVAIVFAVIVLIVVVSIVVVLVVVVFVVFVFIVVVFVVVVFVVVVFVVVVFIVMSSLPGSSLSLSMGVDHGGTWETGTGDIIGDSGRWERLCDSFFFSAIFFFPLQGMGEVA